MMEFVFVYGTLKRGEPNDHFWSKGHGLNSFIGTGCTVDKFPLVVASRHNIPFLLDEPGHGHHVKGEIYTVDDSMLKALDEFEDVPDFYNRLETTIKIFKDNSTMKCWVYRLSNYKKELLTKTLYEDYKSELVEGRYSEMDDDVDTGTEYYNEVRNM